MRFYRAIAAALTLFFAPLTHAQTIVDFMNGAAPFWVLRGTVPADIDLNFAQGRYYQKGTPLGQSVGNLVTVSRALGKYCQFVSGLWISVSSNVACITDQGALIEEARTNDALQSRDMTQAVWTKVGLGTALNAVGIDGIANSATTLTATGSAGVCTSSCTALQSITLGSTSDTYSVFLQRVTGTGAVSITINNLTGTTACTLTTTAFTRCSVTATLANPVIGIKMATGGDVVVADFNQMEPGGFATSPMLTTSVAVTRPIDIATLTVVPLIGTSFSGLVSFNPEAPATYANGQALLSVSDGTLNNRIQIARLASTGLASVSMTVSGSTVFTPSGGALAQNANSKISLGVAPGNQGGVANGTGGLVSNGTQAATPAGMNKINIGTRSDNGIAANAYIRDFVIWATTMQPLAIQTVLTK